MCNAMLSLPSPGYLHSAINFFQIRKVSYAMESKRAGTIEEDFD